MFVKGAIKYQGFCCTKMVFTICHISII